MKLAPNNTHILSSGAALAGLTRVEPIARSGEYPQVGQTTLGHLFQIVEHMSHRASLEPFSIQVEPVPVAKTSKRRLDVERSAWAQHDLIGVGSRDAGSAGAGAPQSNPPGRIVLRLDDGFVVSSMDASVPTETVLRLRADPNELPGLMDSVHAFGDVAQIPSRAANRIAMVIEELVSNAIKYGYDESGGTIEVILRLSSDRIEITLDDDGRPFDPFGVPEPDLDQQVEDRPIGGLGLHLVRSMTRTRRYRRSQDRNRIDLTVDLHG